MSDLFDDFMGAMFYGKGEGSTASSDKVEFDIDIDKLTEMRKEFGRIKEKDSFAEDMRKKIRDEVDRSVMDSTKSVTLPPSVTSAKGSSWKVHTKKVVVGTYNLCELDDDERFHLGVFDTYSKAYKAAKAEAYLDRTLFIERVGSDGDVVLTYPVYWEDRDTQEEYEQDLKDVYSNLEFLFAGRSKSYIRLVIDAVLLTM